MGSRDDLSPRAGTRWLPLPSGGHGLPGRSRILVVVAAMLLAVIGVPPARAAGDPCAAGGSAVVCENSKPGNPPSEWDIEGAGDATVQGFATTMSVTPGQTIRFKIKASSSYTVDIYRLGYYAGLGARRQAPRWTVSNPANQPACAPDSSTHNYDCGTWSVSTQWVVPAEAVSGVYVAKLSMGTDNSHITFVVRHDTSRSDVIFKTSDATWQAYNTYGGASFYTAPSSLTGTQARAFKVSYNRPFATRGASLGRDFLFSNEYPTLRFLEANGVDVSYTTDIDVSTGATVLTDHKVFLSVGHDEYWTLPERTKVEAARDAGVHLAFLSGNEVYWHATLAPSIDGSNTANRTLVCFKDSWESSQITPGAESTSTWRDPAYAAPHGSRPENALTGTAYMSNDTDLRITVSAAQGKARLWRSTSLASLPAGGSAQLAPPSIGYESDEDIDNGHRPAGLMRLSETTGPTEQLVQNPAGTQVGPGTTTHSLTLYRAASGALVFGAGTINWGWGLDQYHDGDNTNPADARMQQATLNLLADMGVLPTTLLAGLVMPTQSSDSQAPTVTVTSPTAGSTLANGTRVTVTGTAADNGGGKVTNVEVSLDAGATYHRATGTTSWSYAGNLTGAGGSSIRVRASDDSANLSTPTSVALTVTCPCSLFGSTVPTFETSDDTSPVQLGVRFRADVDGFVSGIRFFKGAGNVGTHGGTLWTSTGSALATGTFTGESATGWQTMVFTEPVAVTAGTTYVASYFAPVGRYAADTNYFTAADHRASPLTAPGRQSSVLNGVYASGNAFPSQSYKDTNYWVDVLFSRDDTTPPTIANTSPIAGASSVASTVKPTATFVGTVDPASVTLALTDAAGAAVPGAFAFDAPSRTVRFTPAAALAKGATYTATANALSGTGTPMPAPYSWSFTTSLNDPLPGICPCTIWPDSATPAVASSSDTSSVQVGVKFTSDVDGTATGVRFYKGPLNVGAHTGSVWTAAGGLLGTVSFSGETASGWQTAYFTTPVDLTAGTTYVVSYAAPNGAYSVTVGGLGSAVDSGPLHALAGGGVYTYGTGAPLSPSSANYWVDLVFMASDAAPTVASTSPADTSSNVNVGTSVSATLNGQVQTGSPRLAITDASGASVGGTTTYSAPSRTITFLPGSTLAAGQTYTATVSGATALSGNLMTPYSWHFTTAGGTCPCTLFASSEIPTTVDGGDSSSVELGVSFSPSTTGQVTGVRFYKSVLNSGSHIGNLWSSSGELLATGTFTGESASGWQNLTFTSPVGVVAGTSYVASYFAPQGHYSATGQFFAGSYANGVLSATGANGRYRYGSSSGFPTSSYGATNYWVDPVFMPGTPADVTPPVVSAMTPPAGSTSQSAGSAPSATFNEDVDASRITMTVKGADGVAVGGTTSYEPSTRRATFTPASALARGVRHVVSVSAQDTTGNAMSAPVTWSFTTALPDPAPGVCPCGLWSDATGPVTMSDPDSDSIELGTAFTTDTNGHISAVRFYKSLQNTGSHTVSLWTSAGVRLATAAATSESTTGWQTVTFDTPVPVTSGTSYVVSYLAPLGRYSSTASGLSTPLDAPPLHTPANAGRYLYGAGFPGNTSGTSYLVDPVFVRDVTPPPADTVAPTISAVTVTGTGSQRTISWTTDEPATTSVSYGTAPTSLTSTATGAAGTAHTVTLSGLSSGATYHFRVSSTDASGNVSSLPTTSDTPLSFTINDLAPPNITGVSATGSGTTATVTWTTDEPATTSVSFGTSATSLTSTATGASGTSHAVTLGGLSPNTRYHYRVTSADPSGNATTSPVPTAAAAQYVPSTAPISFSTTGEFATGTGGYVADREGGEVTSTPAAGFEFAGASVPTGLTSTSLVAGGSSVVSGGSATISGAQLATANRASGTSLATAAQLAPGQLLGWTRNNGAASGVRAVFTMGPSGALSAVVNDGAANNVTMSISGTYAGARREYRVDWVNNTAVFMVDGVQKASSGFVPAVSLKAALVDPTRDSSPLVTDWLRIGPYAASSTYVSAVVDAGASVGWDTLTRDVSAPSGTGVTIQVRSGTTATPGTGWTSWSTVPQVGGSITRSSRYLQYRVISTSSGSRFGTAETQGVALTFHVL